MGANQRLPITTDMPLDPAQPVSALGRARADRIFMDYLQRLSQSVDLIVPTARRADRGRGVLLEPLTHKEIQVLELLAHGCSNCAMSQRLCVSDSTVRTHLRNISSKLDVHSRTQAVAVARRLHLIG